MAVRDGNGASGRDAKDAIAQRLGRIRQELDSRRGKVMAAVAAVADEPVRVRKAITVNKQAQEVYAFWRDFENFPRFMAHLESVRVTGDTSHWVAKAPAGRKVEWDAEIVEERADELISWRSLPGADIENSGSVRFVPAPGSRGTEIHVDLTYSPPGGTVGATLAKLFGEEPATQMADDLRRFKQVLEIGEVVVSEGSPAGHAFAQHRKQYPAQPLPDEALQ
jgi:uncharacterized membrane protein